MNSPSKRRARCDPSSRCCIFTSCRISEALALSMKRTKARFSVPKLNAAYDRDKDRINSMLQRNSTQAETFGFPGTPAYIIGTAIYPGVVAPKDMKAAIAEARKS